MISRRKGWLSFVKSLIRRNKGVRKTRRSGQKSQAFSAQYLEQRCLLTTLGTFDFEVAGDYTLTNGSGGSASDTTDGADDYYTRTNGGNIGVNNVYTSPQGSFFYAVQDTNGDVASSTTIVQTFDAVSIAGATNVRISVMVAEDDASDGAEDWDADAALKFQYSIDGAAFQTVLGFECCVCSNIELQRSGELRVHVERRVIDRHRPGHLHDHSCERCTEHYKWQCILGD